MSKSIFVVFGNLFLHAACFVVLQVPLLLCPVVVLLFCFVVLQEPLLYCCFVLLFYKRLCCFVDLLFECVRFFHCFFFNVFAGKQPRAFAPN